MSGLPVWPVDEGIDLVACPASALVPDLRVRGWTCNRQHSAFPSGDWGAASAALEAERAIIAHALAGSASDVEFEQIVEELEAVEADLCDLDAGVAGLVLALNAAGFATTASCRAHPTRSPATHPYVIVAGDEDRVSRLRELLGKSGACAWVEDEISFGVYSSTLGPLMALAEALLEDRVVFDALPETIPGDEDLYTDSDDET